MPYAPKYCNSEPDICSQRALNDLRRARLSISRMIWLLAHSLPPSPGSKLDRRHTGRLKKSDNLHMGGGGRGAESYDRKKVYPSINHSKQARIKFRLQLQHM
jgi:hypothetical protein